MLAENEDAFVAYLEGSELWVVYALLGKCVVELVVGVVLAQWGEVCRDDVEHDLESGVAVEDGTANYMSERVPASKTDRYFCSSWRVHHVCVEHFVQHSMWTVPAV